MREIEIKFSKNPFIFWFISLPIAIWDLALGQSERLYHLFSIPELARTLFAPWKRDEFSSEGLALNDRVNIWAGNLATRFVAAIIRSLTIFVGLLGMVAVLVLGCVFITIIFFLPIIIILILIYGLR
jgi:hypothetical protein